MPRIHEDEDLQLAIALSQSLIVGDEEAEVANPNVPEAKGGAMENDLEEIRATEALHGFLAECVTILSSPSSPAEVAALFSPLAEFAMGCCGLLDRLSLDHRTFLARLLELSAARALAPGGVPPPDPGSLHAACRAYLDTSLALVEHAEAGALTRPPALGLARSALATVLALTGGGGGASAANVSAHAEALGAALAAVPAPRFEPAVCASHTLQAALESREASRRAAAAAAGGGLSADPSPRAAPPAPLSDALATCLAALAPAAAAPPPELLTLGLGEPSVASARPPAAAGGNGVRSLKAANAAALLAPPSNGARRLLGCAALLLEPFQLRPYLLRTTVGVSAASLDAHLNSALPCLDVASAIVELVHALPSGAAPAAAVATPAAAAPLHAAAAAPPPLLSELLRLLSSLLATFTLSSHLPSGCGAAPALPQASAAMLRATVCRSVLPNILSLLRAECPPAASTHAAAHPAAHAAWYSNALLGTAAALSWSLGASVPLSALYDPSGALGVAAVSSSASGLESWRGLQASLTQPPLCVEAVRLLLTVLHTLLREDSPPPSLAAAAAGPSGAAPQPAAERLSSPLPSGAAHGGALTVRLAGGFVLHMEQNYTPSQSVELLCVRRRLHTRSARCDSRRRALFSHRFSLPGSTMLDTLVGLLLASCLRHGGAPPRSAGAEASEEAAEEAAEMQWVAEGEGHGGGGTTLLWAVLGRASPPPAAAAIAAAEPSAGGDDSAVQLSLLSFLNAVMHGEGFAASLPAQLRLSLAPRHLRAYVGEVSPLIPRRSELTTARTSRTTGTCCYCSSARLRCVSRATAPTSASASARLERCAARSRRSRKRTR